ncbi:alpha/beta hydrolase [Rhodanobacter sp. BL-MT-08]
MRCRVFVVATLWLMSLSAGVASARQSDGAAIGAHDDHSGNCFDTLDASEIRLWPGAAPGAMGNDACRDIPYLKRYAPASAKAARLPAILIIPGGGYDRLSDAKEQAPVAEYFASHLRVVAFVLYYRLVQRDGTYRYPVPMWDGRRALNFIRHNALALGVDPGRIGVFGFSAGGHLASTLALHPDSDFDLPAHDAVDAAHAAPAFLGLGYPVISMLPSQYASPSSLKHLLYGYDGRLLQQLEFGLSGQHHVARGMAPVFLFDSEDDQRVSAQNSIAFADALSAHRVPAEVHLFKQGVHGSGLSEGIAGEDQWPRLFQSWLQRIGFLER